MQHPPLNIMIIGAPRAWRVLIGTPAVGVKLMLVSMV
jgi:hypothetical protein